MEKDISVMYSQYVDCLDELMKLPMDMKSMLTTTIKNQTNAETEIEKEEATIKNKFLKLKTVAEDNYTNVQRELSEMGIPIPPRQRPSGTQTNILSIQAFENQKKSEEIVRRIIAQIKSKDRMAEDEACKAALALEERKRLAQERLKREKQERERLKQEAEQLRLEDERKAAQKKAAQKKRLLIFGGIGLAILIVTLFFI